MKKLFLFALLPALLVLLGITTVSAQTKNPAPPTIILTWQAHSYIPAGYPGKILPPRETPVDVYLEFIDGGKIAPLDRTLVRWEINNSFLAGGQNLKHISFPLDRFTTRTYAVTATIKDYNDQDIKKTIFINRVDPQVVLTAAPFQKSSEGTKIALTATPFFFSSLNPNDYVFNWLINGVESPDGLAGINVLIPGAQGAQPLSAAVTASNRNNEMESADAQTQFIINN